MAKKTQINDNDTREDHRHKIINTDIQVQEAINIQKLVKKYKKNNINNETYEAINILINDV